jgi:predicted RNA-binding Zn-ribbon protein involved in translation (DUF1610 family)
MSPAKEGICQFHLPWVWSKLRPYQADTARLVVGQRLSQIQTDSVTAVCYIGAVNAEAKERAMFYRCLTCGEVLLDLELNTWYCPCCGSENWFAADAPEPGAQRESQEGELSLLTSSAPNPIKRFKSKPYWPTQFSLS